MKDEILAQAERATGLPLRLALISLITIADRNGVFNCELANIEENATPLEDWDWPRILDLLNAAGYLTVFATHLDDASQDTMSFGFLRGWFRLQTPHDKEKTTLPEPPDRYCHLTPQAQDWRRWAKPIFPPLAEPLDRFPIKINQPYPDLGDQLWAAANGNVEPTALDLAPIRELLDEGIPLETILATVREYVPDGPKLQAWGQDWLISCIRMNHKRSGGLGLGSKSAEGEAVPFAPPPQEPLRALDGRLIRPSLHDINQWADGHIPWNTTWGFKPGHPACTIPDNILQQAGITVFHGKYADPVLRDPSGLGPISTYEPAKVPLADQGTVPSACTHQTVAAINGFWTCIICRAQIAPMSRQQQGITPGVNYATDEPPPLTSYHPAPITPPAPVCPECVNGLPSVNWRNGKPYAYCPQCGTEDPKGEPTHPATLTNPTIEITDPSPEALRSYPVDKNVLDANAVTEHQATDPLKSTNQEHANPQQLQTQPVQSPKGEHFKPPMSRLQQGQTGPTPDDNHKSHNADSGTNPPSEGTQQTPHTILDQSSQHSSTKGEQGPAAGVAPSLSPVGIPWPDILDGYAAGNLAWEASWGPRPREVGCRVPVELLRAAGLDSGAAAVGAKAKEYRNEAERLEEDAARMGKQ